MTYFSGHSPVLGRSPKLADVSEVLQCMVSHRAHLPRQMSDLSRSPPLFGLSVRPLWRSRRWQQGRRAPGASR